MIIAIITIRLLELLEWLLIFRALCSWFPQVQASRIGEFLYAVTEPMVAPFRNLLRRFQSGRGMMLDFSTLLAFLTLVIIERLLYALV